MPPNPTTTPPVPGSSPASDLRATLARLPKGVTVLTTVGPTGPVGMTTSAVNSLSLDPPLILACLANRSTTLELIRHHGAFAVNVLPHDSTALSETFAGGPLPDRFTGVPHHTRHQVPVLDDALAWITCTVHTTHPGGDHTILIGHVTATDQRPGEPLVRYGGGYRVLRHPCTER